MYKPQLFYLYLYCNKNCNLPRLADAALMVCDDILFTAIRLRFLERFSDDLLAMFADRVSIDLNSVVRQFSK